ncbi:filamentous hemagglutinin N-terminal domain-containing protein, partial [Acidocella sp.]
MRQPRAAWLATTAFTAILLAPATLRAQTALAPDTTPQGGVVTGGTATITQGTGTTTIDQSSQRTAIDWQSFNIGSGATVRFNQPSSTAIALNNVVSATPSIIAGKITANGQIVIVNQSGVVFTHGSQVNAESIVVSTSKVATADFMAGHLVFSGPPNPGAKIVNDGELTAGQAGLVGLVAPQVANNGVITARLGQVVLAGASAFTLDLYGDRLISLDVTQAVRAVDVGGHLVPALVTNKGLILADGGKITLTARDADALVTQLIDAGGTIRANTVGSTTGAISVTGVGGNIQIAGNLLAQGTAAGEHGGTVEALTTGTVSVAPTAVIDASGAAGGGIVALGTDIARASAGAADSTAPRAAAVQVAAGAQIKADATGTGNGGKAVLLSSGKTDFAGAISVRGATGGNGGLAEISSDGVISLSGTADATALDGHAGEVLLDPQTLIVTSSAGSASNVSYIDPSSLTNLSGTIDLAASKIIAVDSAINLTGTNAVSLVSNGDMLISASIATAGSLEIDASGSLDIAAGLTASSIALSNSGSGGVLLGAPVLGTLVALQSSGGVTETSGGVIDAATLISASQIGGNALLGNANSITTLGSFAASGNIVLNDIAALAVTGMLHTPSSLTLEDAAGVSELAGGTISAA